MSSRAVELICGLEVHVRLDTGGKLFCGCRVPSDLSLTRPNRHICDVCIGHPGTMPSLQSTAVEYGLALALALGSYRDDLKRTSRFERKHYFYWDLPKNYQITQIDDPLCGRARVHVGSHLAGIEGRDDGSFELYLNRIHLEEDAARISSDSKEIRVDFNRSSTVLAEIVTEPEFRTPEQPAHFLRHLRTVLQWHDLGTATLGNMRADVNVSVRWEGDDHLNPKVEIKNVTNIDTLPAIIRYEQNRLTQLLEARKPFVSETREWNEELGVTDVLRSKEEESDYWYYVEPDLVDIQVDEDLLDRAASLLRPDRRQVWDELVALGFDENNELPALFATAEHAVLVQRAVHDGADLETARHLMPLLKAAVDELDQRRTGDEGHEDLYLSSRARSFESFWEDVKPRLALLTQALAKKTVQPHHLRILTNGRALYGGRDWSTVDELLAAYELDAALGSDDLDAEVNGILDEVLAAHPEQREAWLSDGDKKLFNFFQGQVMRRLPKGSDGHRVFELLKERQQQAG